MRTTYVFILNFNQSSLKEKNVFGVPATCMIWAYSRKRFLFTGKLSESECVEINAEIVQVQTITTKGTRSIPLKWAETIPHWTAGEKKNASNFKKLQKPIRLELT